MTAMVTLLIMERLVIDVHDSTPSYQQLADQLRALIAAGAIGPREPLPSLTYIHGETGLSVGTIRKAIGVLIAGGWAYTVPGRGTFAAAKLPG